MGHGSMHQQGFTLIELVCILVLLGVLATGIYIQWPGAVISLGAQAHQLANDVRYTQALSMTKGQRYQLTITSSTAYQILNSSGTAIVNTMGATTTALKSGVTFGTLSNLPNSLIVFNGQGIPYIDTSSPGTTLSTTASIPLVGGGVTKTIIISPQTGRVIVQ